MHGAGVSLSPTAALNFSRFTGETGTFEFSKDGTGTLSGLERMWWTTSDCTTDYSSVTSELKANFSQGTSTTTGTTSDMTLLTQIPAEYTMCYDSTGSGTFALISAKKLLLKGWRLCECVYVYIIGLTCQGRRPSISRLP